MRAASARWGSWPTPTLRMLERVFGKLGRVMHVRANGGDDAPVEAGRCREVGVQRDDVRDATSRRREDVEAAHRHHRGEGGPPSCAARACAGRTLALRVQFERPQRALGAAPAGRVPSDDELALHAASVSAWWRKCGVPARRCGLIGVGMGGFSDEAAVVQESLFDVAEAAPAEADVEPRRRATRESAAASSRPPTLVKDRFGEAALRFGRELRDEGNTTGSASKNPADYK